MSETFNRVRGFPDRLTQDCLHFDQVLSQATSVIKSFSFDRVETPILEYANLFTHTLGSHSDVVHKEMYSFQQGKEVLTLRPEGTAPIARLFITEKLQRQIPLKFFYYGPMFRHERPQKGRFRQFYQLGVEVFGDKSPTIDAEILSMAWLIMKKLDIDKKVTLEINSLGSISERDKYKEVLKQFLKSKKLSPDSQRRFQENPLRIWDSKEESDQVILEKAPRLMEFLKKDSIEKYQAFKLNLSNLKIPYKENFKLVRGLDYYNDLVFEITSSELGSQSGLLAGGRYDSLVKKLGGLDTPATGWGAGIERLLLLHKSNQTKLAGIGLVSIGDEAQRKAFQLAFQLREKGHKVYYNFSGNISKQMKRIQQKNCSMALFYGEKEIKADKVGLKNLETQKQIEVSLSQLDQFLDPLN
ncbi:MAG: histidine--tRNA ligase [Bdellovibrionales bacterium]